MSESICCDTSTEKDSLGFIPYVEAIAEFLTNKDTEAPVTLSIEGQWGCGKSSFMKQLKENIESKNLSNIKTWIFLKYLFSKNEENISTELSPLIHILREYFQKIPGRKTKNLYSSASKLKATRLYIYSIIKRKKYYTVWFNGWRYEKEDELWAAFAISLMEHLSEQLSWEKRLLAQFKLKCLRLKFKWRSKTPVYIYLVLFAFAIWVLNTHPIPRFNGFSFPNSIDESFFNLLVTLFGILGFIIPVLKIGKDVKDVVGNPFDFSKFVSNPNYMDHISFIENFHSDFGKIIKSYAGNSRVYVFVDDLDRCEIPKAAELMQAINLMISDEANIYFCIGMDRKVISAAFAAKHESLLPYLNDYGMGYNSGFEYGYEFIEKFIQLPFKVPSPKNEDFKSFINFQHKNKNSFKTSKLSVNQLTGKQSVQIKSLESVKLQKDTTRGITKEKSKKEEKILNNYDCQELSETFESIIEMVAPALDRNPRRMKQFLNLFRFQRTIGLKTGLFSYKKGTNPKYKWNCKKLAKFVVISIKWPSIVYALNSDLMILEQLQEYALELENGEENLKKWSEDKHLNLDPKYQKKWINDEKLIELLRVGCVESEKITQNVDEYSLSNIDFSKLLQISPVVITAFPLFTQDNLETSRKDYNAEALNLNQYLKIVEEMGDESGVATTLYQLGNVHYLQGNYEEAIKKYDQSLKTFEDIGNKSGIASTLHQLGIINQDQGNYQEALNLYEKSLSMNKELGNESEIAETLQQLGTLHEKKEEYELALQVYFTAFDIFDKLRSSNRELVRKDIERLKGKIERKEREKESTVKLIKCPHCGYKYYTDVELINEEGSTVSVRGGDFSDNKKVFRKHIDLKCPNCKKEFKWNMNK